VVGVTSGEGFLFFLFFYILVVDRDSRSCLPSGNAIQLVLMKSGKLIVSMK